MKMNKDSDFRAFLARNVTAVIMVIIGLVFVGIGMYAMRIAWADFSNIGQNSTLFGQDLKTGFSMLQEVSKAQIFGLLGVVGGAIVLLAGAVSAQMVELDSRRESQYRLSEEKMAKELEKSFSVHEVSSADEIWLNSTRILNDLAEKGYRERHEYDVTTYFNRIHYEEMVAKCVSQGVSFKRVFCFRVQNTGLNDELMEWYLRSIESGLVINLDDLNKQTFKRDLLLAFKEHEGDTCATDLTAAHVERINKIICAQSGAMLAGNLTITPLARRMPIDFVVVDYVAKSGGPQEYEVQANFKTAPLTETYVAGTYGKGAYARHYQQLFINVIHPGVV